MSAATAPADAAPRVEFRVGVADPVGYCCALLRTAVAKGARCVVCAPAPLLDELDQRLWTFSQLDFLAHCRAGDAHEQRNPIVLAEPSDVRGLQGRDCLVNLGESEVAGWQHMPRVIELVGVAEPAKAAARQRFRMYRGAGCQPQTLEVGREA